MGSLVVGSLGRDSLILASGYGVEALSSVLDHWEDVEAAEQVFDCAESPLQVPIIPATEAIAVADMMSRFLGLNRAETLEKALRLKAPEYLRSEMSTPISMM